MHRMKFIQNQDDTYWGIIKSHIENYKITKVHEEKIYVLHFGISMAFLHIFYILLAAIKPEKETIKAHIWFYISDRIPLNTLPAGFELWRNLRSDFAWWNSALVITTTTLAWWLSHMKTPYCLNLKHPIALE